MIVHLTFILNCAQEHQLGELNKQLKNKVRLLVRLVDVGLVVVGLVLVDVRLGFVD